MEPDDIKATIVMVVTLTALAVLVIAIVEMQKSTRRIEVVVTKADSAAAHAWEVIEEARRITQEAANGEANPDLT